jgi:hypothetical protein
MLKNFREKPPFPLFSSFFAPIFSFFSLRAPRRALKKDGVEKKSGRNLVSPPPGALGEIANLN